MNERQLQRLFGILLKYGGRISQWEQFKNYFGELDPIFTHWEFRGFGDLGFGGKLYWDLHRLRASYYSEDETPEVKALCQKINKELEEFQAEYL